MFCSDGLLKIAANDGFCVCFAVRHVSLSLYLMGLYRWVFFFLVSPAVVALGLAVGMGMVVAFYFSSWWWVCD